MFTPELTTEVIERVAALMPSGEMDRRSRSDSVWAERSRSFARSMLLLQANRLEEIAATDDLTLYRQAKDDDAAYTAFRQYFIEHQPVMAAIAKNGGHSNAMLAFLRGDICDRRSLLLGSALLIRQLASSTIDKASLDAAVDCMKKLPPAIHI